MLRLGLYTGASRTAMARASLILDFIMPTLDKRIDFTRTTAATYVDSDGYIKNTPASKNLLTYTQEFDNAAWVKLGTEAYPFNKDLISKGPELLINGDFSSNNTGWSLTATAPATSTISGGKLTLVSPAGETASASQSVLKVGKWYRITGSVTVRSGTAKIIAGGPLEYYFTSTQDFTLYIYSSTGGSVILSRQGTCDCDFDNISTVEVYYEGLVAPDSTKSASLLYASASNSIHRILGNGAVANIPQSFSFYIKAGTHRYVQINNGSSTSLYANFDLLTGTIGTYGVDSQPFIEDHGNGWYRCGFVGTPTAVSGTRVALVPSSSATFDQTWTANGTEYIHLWGAQVEIVPASNLILGPDVLLNGDFSNGSTGWSVANADATHIVTFANGTMRYQSDTTTPVLTVSPTTSMLTVGKWYSIEVTTSAHTSGSIKTDSFGTLPLSYGVGTSTVYGKSVTTLLFITRNSSNVDITIDKIKVQEILGATGMPTSYTRNFGGLYPARFDYDSITKVPKGFLVEEQRTNLLLYSNDFDKSPWNRSRTNLTLNATTSPDGSVNATKIYEDTSALDTHQIRQVLTGTTATYTYSLYMKAAERNAARLLLYDGTNFVAQATFNLELGTITFGSGIIIPVGNGWYRCIIAGVLSTSTNCQAELRLVIPDGSTSYTGDGVSGIYMWGAQLETGQFPTSYIPTLASQVTRATDRANIMGNSFSQFYNQSAGTLLVECDSNVAINTTAYYPASANDGSGINAVNVYEYNGRWGSSVKVGGDFQADLNIPSSYLNNVVAKIALAYSTNDFATSVNGSTAIVDSSGSVPSVTLLSIGSVYGSGSINGHIRSIRYYPTRLSNAQLQALTAP